MKVILLYYGKQMYFITDHLCLKAKYIIPHRPHQTNKSFGRPDHECAGAPMGRILSSVKLQTSVSTLSDRTWQTSRRQTWTAFPASCPGTRREYHILVCPRIPKLHFPGDALCADEYNWADCKSG